MNDDQELLRAFAEEKSQAAFTALVQQHLPMIYAAAYRQTGDAHRAQEICQAAFTLLARKAGALRHHPAIGGWLYTTTGHLAARLRRTEARRSRREQEAHAMHEANAPADVVNPDELRPIIDALMLALPEHDRTAVLLRFFENRTHAQVGARLGLSENAARMRVDRALEQLRVALQRRGIVSTAAALGTALTAQASIIPPAGLATGIAASASTAIAGGSVFFLMNTSLLKTGMVVAALGIAGGGFLWQQHENARLRTEVASLQTGRKNANPDAIPPARPPAEATSGDMARLSAQVSALPSNPAASWQERADVLQELVAQFPAMQIPELALATPEDWLDATKTPLKDDNDYRRAMAQVRTAVVQRFSGKLSGALRSYLQQNGGTFPTEPAQLESHFKNPLGPEVWQHYEISPSSRFPNLVMGGDRILTVKSPADPDYDIAIAIGSNGTGTTPHRTAVIQTVRQAYLAANPGKQPMSLGEILPYAKTNAQRSAIQAEMASQQAYAEAQVASGLRHN